jgi:hypothetical protein
VWYQSGPRSCANSNPALTNKPVVEVHVAKPLIRRKIIPENPVAVGKRFTRLVVIEDGWEQVGSTGRVADVVKVRCDCGTEKFVRPGALTRETTLSCGCLHKEKARELCKARVTHGCTRPSDPKYLMYRAYHSMIQRCYNPRVKKYPAYGGRGITVCDRWLGDGGFENYLADMGERPKGMSLDRIDNNGPYAPDNCQWASQSEQCNNRRSNRLITYRGVQKTLTQWARENGLEPALVSDRLSRGWSVSRALSTPMP